MTKLTQAYDRLNLSNRVVMAPMTRCRATSDHVPTEMMATYYQQRAQAGLIITEGTAPSPNGVGYARIPGIYTPEQVTAWKKVTDAVHDKGGVIFIQLMHTGRISHPDNMPVGAQVVAPSALVASTTKMYVDGKGELSLPTPKAMTLEDIALAKQEFVNAAENAVKAGFDGVEIHAANGYLLDQFLNPQSNERIDDYGGSIANRNRIVLEIVDATVNAIGAKKVGIRISPNGAMNDISGFDEQHEQFDQLVEGLNRHHIAYLHLVNHEAMGAPALPEEIRKTLREKFNGTFILSGGYDEERAERHLNASFGDLVAFGRPFIANPDLVQRFKKNAPLQNPKQDFFYTPGPEGYIDYPTLESVKA